MIFLGVNILESDGDSLGPVYTFQDTVSYSRFGSAADYKGPADLSAEGARTYSFSAGEVLDLVDLGGAAEALNDAVQRAHWKGR